MPRSRSDNVRSALNLSSAQNKSGNDINRSGLGGGKILYRAKALGRNAIGIKLRCLGRHSGNNAGGLKNPSVVKTDSMRCAVYELYARCIFCHIFIYL